MGGNEREDFTVGNLTVENLVGGVAPFTGFGKSFYLDPTNGSDGNSGLNPRQAKATMADGYALLTAGRNDTLVYLSGSSSLSIEAFTWAKSYTHFVALGAPTHAAQRARIFNSTTTQTASAALLTISASGCIFKNFYIFQGEDTNQAQKCVTVTGGRNYFENVHFAGMGHASISSETDSDSLFMNGAEENLFKKCTIGVTTTKRTGVNTQIRFDGSAKRNVFEKCKITNWSETAGHPLITEADAAAMEDYNIFEDCLFFNFWTNHGGTLTEVMDANVGATHDTIFINPLMVGILEIEAGDVASVKATGPAMVAATGIAVTPTT